MFTDRISVVTPSHEGWDEVMLEQYCVRPEVEIILFGIIAAKHLISHQTFFHTKYFCACVFFFSFTKSGEIRAFESWNGLS